MAIDNGATDPTLYQILQVHPAAPLDLITNAYWRLTGHAQSLQGANRATEFILYHLTRAYETLANPAERAAYDLSLGVGERPPTKLPRRKRGISALFAGQRSDIASQDSSVDYYELLRIDPRAHPLVVAEAYTVMRNYYLRRALQDQSPEELLDLLDEAHAVIADLSTRERYDAERTKNGRSTLTPTADAPSAAESTERPLTEFSTRSEPPSPPVEPATTPLINTEAIVATPEPIVNADQPQHSRSGSRPSRAMRNGRRSSVQPAANVAEPATQIAARTTAREVGSRIKFVQSVAARSAGLVVSGVKGSVTLARTASQRFRQAVDERSADRELAAAEEDALLSRVSTSPVAPSPSDDSSARSVMIASLTMVDGAEDATTFDLSGSSFILGSDGACDASLAGLADQQARVLYSNGRFALYSLAESPELRIHGDNVDWAVLENGDVIEVGPYTLRFETSLV